jgi:hypothetical protein
MTAFSFIAINKIQKNTKENTKIIKNYFVIKVSAYNCDVWIVLCPDLESAYHN